MVLCICQSVTDREVDAAIQEGARSLDELAVRCGAGSDCGCCREALEERLAVDGSACGRGCADCPRPPRPLASVA